MEAGNAAAEGMRRVLPDVACVVRPLADGGEGTVEQKPVFSPRMTHSGIGMDLYIHGLGQIQGKDAHNRLGVHQITSRREIDINGGSRGDCDKPTDIVHLGKTDIKRNHDHPPILLLGYNRKRAQYECSFPKAN